MGRNAVPDVYSENDDFEFGKAKILSEGKDIALIATGETVYHAVKAVGKLAEEGIEATVVDLVSVKPFDEETVLNAIKNTKCVLTVEEHSIYGGVGAMVAELTSQEYPVKMKILGIPDENVINAKPIEILEYYGLTTENIVSEAKKLLAGL